MKVKRFFAPDMSTAMRTVREEVGPDAVILSNNSVAGGVEVVVALEYVDGPQVSIPAAGSQGRAGVKPLIGMKKPLRTAADLERARAKAANQSIRHSVEPLMKPRHRDGQLNLDDAVWDDVLAALDKKPVARTQQQQAPRRAPASFSALVDDELPRVEPVLERSPGNAIRERLNLQEEQPPRINEDHQALQAMRAEIDELKSMLRDRLKANIEPEVSKVVADNPVVTRLSRQFEKMSLEPRLIAHLLQGVEADKPVDKAWKVVLRRLSDALPAVGEDIIERGGILAFVGATGAGKTTTIGKLATQYVLKHGSAGIALVTTDAYRIAAHEQLRTFGRILDVPVRVVDENHSLDETLHSLRDKRLILIDTAGLSSSPSQRRAQLDMLSDSGYRIKKVMVMPCTAQYKALQSQLQPFKGLGLNAAVLTKLDEAVSLGEVISLVVDQRLPVAYLADGQKIPDNIEVARANALVSRAVVLSEQQVKLETNLDQPAAAEHEPESFADYLETQRVG